MGTFAGFMRDRRTAKAKAADQDTLEALARMRWMLKDARMSNRKSVVQHRDEAGQFRKHEPMNSLDKLMAHLTSPDHSAAILPEWRGSTRNMQAAHLAMHANGADHDLEEGM
jgi:hypothetical protein